MSGSQMVTWSDHLKHVWNRDKKCILNSDKSVSETGIKRVWETGIKKCPNGGNFGWKNGGNIFGYTYYPHLWAPNWENFGKNRGGNFITFLGIKCVWTCLAPAQSPQGRVSQAMVLFGWSCLELNGIALFILGSFYMWLGSCHCLW